MSRCRRDSFYLAPGLLCYFKDHTLATWDPETGKLVRFFHRADIAAFERRFPSWDGMCLLAKSGGLGVLQKMLRDDPGSVEIWRLDSRLVEGRRPADACSYVMHRWAVEGSVPGGARALIPLLFPSAEPIHKGLHAAALHAIGDNAQLAVHVVSAAWQAGLFASPAQAAAMLRDLTPLSKGVLVQPDPRLVSMFASGIDPANVDLKNMLTGLANPYTHINPASVSIMLGLNTPLAVLRRLEMQADVNMLERIWEHPNYPREEYLSSVARAAKSKSEDVRRLAAHRTDLPDEMLFDFAASTYPDVVRGALHTLKEGLGDNGSWHKLAKRWAADTPELQAERAARLAAIATGAWKSGDPQIKQSVLKLVEALDPGLLASLTDDLFKALPPSSIGTVMDEDSINLHVLAALSRCAPGSPISEDAWAHIGKVIAAIHGPAGLERWYAPDLREALSLSIREDRRYTYTNNYDLLYAGLDPAALAIPQHVVDAVLSAKVPTLLEALASNPHLGYETTRKLIELDLDGSLTRTIAKRSSDETVLRELFAKDVELAKLVAGNPRAPRDLLLAVSKEKATYTEGQHKGVGRDQFGLKNASTYEMVMRNQGLGGMTLAELEAFLADRRADGAPQVRDDFDVLLAVVSRTTDPRVIQVVLAAQPKLWLAALDLPSLPADMRRSFIAAAASDDGTSVGLDSAQLGSVVQNWLVRTKTVSVDELWALAGSPRWWTRLTVAEYKDTPADLLEYLSHDKDGKVLSAVLVHKNTPSSAVARLCEGPSPAPVLELTYAKIKAAHRDDLSREATWALAGDEDAGVRATIAATTTEADLLHLLATGSDVKSRAAAATNKSLPLDLLLALANDGSSRVRTAAASNVNLPEARLLAMLEDSASDVVHAAIAACYIRRISVPADLLCSLFDHPGIVEDWVNRDWDRSHWWKHRDSIVSRIAEALDDAEARDVLAHHTVSPLAYVGQMLDYEDPKTQALLRRLFDTGSFNADPDMHECVARLLNLPLPLRLHTLEEQRRMNTVSSEPVSDLDDLGLATVPYPVEGFRAEMTEHLADAAASEIPEYGLLVPRLVESPSAQRRNANYMGNCTFSYYGPETLAGRAVVVGFYGEGSSDPVLNALLTKNSAGWSVLEVNSRFNQNVTRATAEAVAAVLGLPLYSGLREHEYLPGRL